MTKKLPPKKRGRKPKLDAELVAAALVELQGNIAATAKRFGVDRSAVRQLIDKHPALQAILHDAREGMKDNAESALQRAILGGEAWAVCFFLKCQAKDRGYSERTEHTGADGGPIKYADTLTVEQRRTELLGLIATLRERAGNGAGAIALERGVGAAPVAADPGPAPPARPESPGAGVQQ